MPAFPLDELTVVLLKKGIVVGRFDCGDADLNEFLKEDAFAYSEQELAKTYVALYRNEPVSFISVCADAIKLSDEETEAEFGKKKEHADYPAVKIARLAVARQHQRSKIGITMVEYAIGKAIELSESVGCRFVTVDAYPAQQRFYEKCNFTRNEKDSSGANVSMRLDLLPFKQAYFR